MVTSRPDLWQSLKTSRRANHDGEPGPIAVQIAGTEPQMMADAAAYNVDRGAQIIDINMGCPAKKVCNKWAGSALMQDEALALSIVEAVVRVCAPRNVPVTLKMRTGWCQSQRNAVRIARDAESAGVQMLAVHGRTREQGYGARPNTTPSPRSRARCAFRWWPMATSRRRTRRARCCGHRRRRGHDRSRGAGPALDLPRRWRISWTPAPSWRSRWWARSGACCWTHLEDHYDLYGEHIGVLSARKHIGWYVTVAARWRGVSRRDEPLDGLRRRSRAPWPTISTHWARSWTGCPSPRRTMCRIDSHVPGDTMSKKHIEECVRASLDGYFRDLRGTEPDGMYDMMVRVVEKPLLEVVMQQADNNQSRAAQWLGLNRNTLRKKLLEHKLLK